MIVTVFEAPGFFQLDWTKHETSGAPVPAYSIVVVVRVSSAGLPSVPLAASMSTPQFSIARPAPFEQSGLGPLAGQISWFSATKQPQGPAVPVRFVVLQVLAVLPPWPLPPWPLPPAPIGSPPPEALSPPHAGRESGRRSAPRQRAAKGREVVEKAMRIARTIQAPWSLRTRHFLGARLALVFGACCAASLVPRGAGA